ncbi:nitrogenase [Nostoc sp. CENA543]|uniref:Mo-dependent nitrogenase C-terminal domain-containing protein n=1 Tax=Nostoc sp. CENA543 TaxID=1869241 RepID=UPI000CA2B5FC|nr:Mo-dependent nitrogenase C-terminal domain-containing protein [Nostoc sp. CENA543]AUT00652.1 nitrogenase [Nostoc sp. CENA543]
MSVIHQDHQDIVLSAFIQPMDISTQAGRRKKFDLLKPLRQWLDDLEIQNRQLAYFIAKLIPAQCPFERDIVLFGRKIAHIPPMCKLNPLYDQFVGLRFRALCYLVDKCGEDIQSYC